MSNLVKHISNLIGGISRQPPQTRLSNQCEDQKNFISSPALGLTVRPSLKYRSSSEYTDDGAFFILDRDADTQHNLWISPSGIRVEDLNGNVKSVQYTDDALAYLSLPRGAKPRDYYRILPIADHCYIINRSKEVQVDSNSYTVRKNQALVHIKQVNHGTTWSLSLDGVLVNFGYSSDTDQSVSTQQVATSLASSLLADSTIAASFNIITASSVIYITRKDGEAFSIGLSDTRGNTYSSLTTYKIKEFTDLPTIAVDGFVCKVSGNNGSTADDYYVRFRGSNTATKQWINTLITLSDSSAVEYNKALDNDALKVGAVVSCTGVPSFRNKITNKSVYTEDGVRYVRLGFNSNWPSNHGYLTYQIDLTNTDISVLTHGTWEECEAPNQPTSLNNTTMPHVLVHDMVRDTWIFRSVEWSSRKVGDDESAPFPSFVHKTITNAFVYRNRIGFIAGDSVSMSAAGDLENFFPETVQTMTDSDPIDMNVAVDDYSDILATTTVQDNLIFWSKKRQYTLTTPDTFSPKTAAILPTTAYACIPDAGLPVIGARVYFVDTDNENDQVYEYAVDNTTATKEGICITAHVPDLITHANPITLTASQTAQILALFSPATPNTIWLYQFYLSGNQKLQSAWSRQVIDGVIKNIGFRGSELWLEVLHNGQRIMVTMDFMIKRSRTANDYVPSLDYFIEYENPDTEIELPYTPSETFTVLVSNAKDILIPLKQVTHSEGRLWLNKAYSRVYIGERFERYYEFSEVWTSNTSQDNNQLILSSGRVQLRRWDLDFTATGTFTVEVNNKIYNSTTPYLSQQQAKLGSGILNTPVFRSGKFSVPCRGQNNEITVAIRADDWLPATFLSADVSINYTRHQRTI